MGPGTTSGATHLGAGSRLRLLVSLGLGDGSLAGGVADLGLLRALGKDGSEVGTDDAALGLDGLARALLGDLLSHALLVHPAVDLRPCDLARVLALQEEGLGLVVEEPEDLWAAEGTGSGQEVSTLAFGSSCRTGVATARDPPLRTCPLALAPSYGPALPRPIPPSLQ